MGARRYLIISGSIFGIVAAAHLLRMANGWEMRIGSWAAPMGVSWLGTIFPAALAFWAFRLAGRP
jgi:hypothetical protein